MQRTSIDRHAVINVLDIKETLEELLLIYNACIISINSSKIKISSQQPLPNEVRTLATYIEVSMSSFDMAVLGKHTMCTESLKTDYLYVFEAAQYNIIKGLIWLASEKQRYEAFSKEIDKEIVEELSPEQE